MPELDRIRTPLGVSPLIRSADRPGDRPGEQGRRREGRDRREDTVELSTEVDRLPEEASAVSVEPSETDSLDIEA
ncbi:MAG: hypothetical protein KIS66_06515 [Fimbriimonadaceae bacterium]|nr:hypothetical protein [Fimbriimonadaceae bacterium]